VSNAKLLRLHATFTEVKSKFGTREKLVDAVLVAEGRAKDTGLRQKLSTWPVPRLYDAYKSATKRAAVAAGGEAGKAAATKGAKGDKPVAGAGKTGGSAAKKAPAPAAAKSGSKRA
jgi:hypothetical protein